MNFTNIALLCSLLVLLVGAGCGDDDGTRSSEPDTGPTVTDTDVGDDLSNPASDTETAPDIAPDLPSGLDFDRLSPECFSGGEQPQLDLDGPVTNWTWNDPHVLADDGEYSMYASATDSFQFPVRLYRLRSGDPENWSLDPSEPILDVGEAGTWDAGGVETPAVVLWRGRYHLFYTGYEHVIGDPQHSVSEFRVGQAVSDDGVSFDRVAGGPVVAPSGEDSEPANDWYAFIVGEPGPVVVDDVLYLYFTAVGVDHELGAALQVIGVTTTTDGEHWSAPHLALGPDQTLYPRGDDWVGYSTPNAIVLGDRVHLFFDVAHQPDGGDWLQQRLHHASSADGLSAWIHDEAAIMAAGDLPWAVGEVRSPHALLDGTLLRLYFAGHELDGVPPEHFAIGMMTCDLAR